MGAPRSLAGLVASVEVETADWHAGLSAVRKHTGGKDDLALLSVVHCTVSPDGNLYLVATDRYTVGAAVVSIWGDHVGSGELVEFDLGPDDVRDLGIFKPAKGDNPENRLRLDVGPHEVTVTEVAGMIETDADKSLTLPRLVFTEKYPDVGRLVAGGIRQAVALRERAEDAGSTSDAAVEEVFTNAALIGRFDAAASAYKEPLVIQRTAEARTALLISCGESFVGMLMPIKPGDDTLVKHRTWQAGWIRRLPEPDDVPVTLPDPVAEPSEAGDDLAAPGPGDVHEFRGDEWRHGMGLIVSERLAVPVEAPRAHPDCHGPDGHVCQQPSGKPCVEHGCDEPAGTLWGPLWCPRHDAERLERVSASMDGMLAEMDAQAELHRGADVVLSGADS